MMRRIRATLALTIACGVMAGNSASADGLTCAEHFNEAFETYSETPEIMRVTEWEATLQKEAPKFETVAKAINNLYLKDMGDYDFRKLESWLTGEMDDVTSLTKTFLSPDRMKTLEGFSDVYCFVGDREISFVDKDTSRPPPPDWLVTLTDKDGRHVTQCGPRDDWNHPRLLTQFSPPTDAEIELMKTLQATLHKPLYEERDPDHPGKGKVAVTEIDKRRSILDAMKLHITVQTCTEFKIESQTCVRVAADVSLLDLVEKGLQPWTGREVAELVHPLPKFQTFAAYWKKNHPAKCPAKMDFSVLGDRATEAESLDPKRLLVSGTASAPKTGEQQGTVAPK